MAAWTYVAHDAGGRCIYVGATRNLRRRLDAHKSTWWAPQVARITAKVHRTYADALAAEKALILEHLPRWNIHGKWETRHRWDAAGWADYRKAFLQNTNGRPLTVYQRAHLANVDRLRDNYLCFRAVAA